MALSAPEERPNILLIVVDDMGYSDLGVFGGEINTPHIDALAESGVKLTQFYAAPACALTRAIMARQETTKPVHEWELASIDEFDSWRESYRKVGQFMTTDLFTVRPEDVVDLAAFDHDHRRPGHPLRALQRDDGRELCHRP